MNEVIAEFRIDNVFVPFIYISKSPIKYKSSHIRVSEPEEYSNLLLDQGFVWYQDFIAFDMLRDYQSYWVKITISESLKLDSFIANAESGQASVILLPFQITDQERVCVFGDDNVTATFSFTLPAGHYQLLFQNREFTRGEIEALPNNDCEDMDYDDWENQLELCLLTFIPTKKPIEPKILAYKGSLRNKNLPNPPLILFDREMYQSGDD